MKIKRYNSDTRKIVLFLYTVIYFFSVVKWYSPRNVYLKLLTLKTRNFLKFTNFHYGPYQSLWIFTTRYIQRKQTRSNLVPFHKWRWTVGKAMCPNPFPLTNVGRVDFFNNPQRCTVQNDCWGGKSKEIYRMVVFTLYLDLETTVHWWLRYFYRRWAKRTYTTILPVPLNHYLRDRRGILIQPRDIPLIFEVFTHHQLMCISPIILYV